MPETVEALIEGLAEDARAARQPTGVCSDCCQFIVQEPHLCDPQQAVTNMQAATFALLVSGTLDPKRGAKGYRVR